MAKIKWVSAESVGLRAEGEKVALQAGQNTAREAVEGGRVVHRVFMTDISLDPVADSGALLFSIGTPGGYSRILLDSPNAYPEGFCFTVIVPSGVRAIQVELPEDSSCDDISNGSNIDDAFIQLSSFTRATFTKLNGFKWAFEANGNYTSAPRPKGGGGNVG